MGRVPSARADGSIGEVWGRTPGSGPGSTSQTSWHAASPSSAPGDAAAPARAHEPVCCPGTASRLAMTAASACGYCEPMRQTTGLARLPDGGRVGFAVVGSGPAVVMPAWWVSNVVEDWHFDPLRRFVEGLAAGRMVVRYDRLGTGLSDRERPPETFTPEFEDATLCAVLHELGLVACDADGHLVRRLYRGELCRPAARARRSPRALRQLRSGARAWPTASADRHG